MTPLRQQMIRELELHRKSPKTIEAYVCAVAQLAAHYRRSPETISVAEVRDFLHYLITVRQLAFSSVNQKAGGIRCFYQHVLGREEFQLKVPMKRSGRLPQPLGRTEISRLFDAAAQTLLAFGRGELGGNDRLHTGAAHLGPATASALPRACADRLGCVDARRFPLDRRRRQVFVFDARVEQDVPRQVPRRPEGLAGRARTASTCLRTWRASAIRTHAAGC